MGWQRYGLSLFLLTLAACGGGKSNVEPPSPLVKFSPTATVKRLWTVDVGQSETKKLITLSPVLNGGTVYVADPAGRVSAIEAETGRDVWRVKTDELIGAIGFGDDLVLLGSKKGFVIALDSKSGELRWKSKVSSEVLSAPAGAAGVVVVRTIDGRIFGISADNGQQLWSQHRTEPSLSLRGTSAPIIAHGFALSGFASGKVAAFDLKTGRSVWERAVAYPRGRSEIERLIDVDAPPLIVGETLFAASYQGKVIAVDMKSGRVLWSRDVSTYTGMDADERSVYISDARGHVLALDQRSGGGLWKQDKLYARVLNAPTLVSEYVAVGDVEGYVHWLSREDGQFAARSRVGGAAIRGKAVAAGNTLFVQSQGGTLAALRIETRTKPQ
ncbi:MAG: outer membrane protein assembly factor BamB [Acidiferrobacterales bacterium]